MSTAVCWAARADVVEVVGGMVGTRWLELEAAVVVEEKHDRCAKEAHSSRAPKHSVVAAIVRFNKWRAEAIITMLQGRLVGVCCCAWGVHVNRMTTFGLCCFAPFEASSHEKDSCASVSFVTLMF